MLNISSLYPLIEYPAQTISVYIMNSFKILTLQRGDAILDAYHFSGDVIDTIFRVLGPIQIALIALEIRVKIKRH